MQLFAPCNFFVFQFKKLLTRIMHHRKGKFWKNLIFNYSRADFTEKTVTMRADEDENFIKKSQVLIKLHLKR